MTDQPTNPPPVRASGERSDGGRTFARGFAGERALRSAAADRWLSRLLGAERDTALVAVGGYGRRELMPGSDLDVVLIHRGQAGIARLADRVWYPIWDSGTRLDHAVRTVEEARAVATEDLRAALGLLHARHVVGDPELTAELRAGVLADWRARARRRLGELVAMTAERAGRFGELAFLLEPDLKEARGGLRDVHAIQAAAAAWVAPGPGRRVKAAYETILDARHALHEVTGRPADRLVSQEQDEVAATLGLPDPDALLRTLAEAARTITHAYDQTARHITRSHPPPHRPGTPRRHPLRPTPPQPPTPPPTPPPTADATSAPTADAAEPATTSAAPPSTANAATPPTAAGPAPPASDGSAASRAAAVPGVGDGGVPCAGVAGGRGREPLVEGLVEQDGEVVLARGVDPGRDPTLLLRAAAAAAGAGLPIAAATLGRLPGPERLPVPWPAAARDALLSLLATGQAAVPVWEALDQAGLIVRLFPAWERVRNRPQHDPVHTFTVDRHLIETAAHAAALTREVSRPDLLLLAALFHDIGKGRPGDHSRTGARLAHDLATRIGLGETDATTLARLVLHHLLLPRTAVHRDPDDPATIATVKATARDPETLALLSALATADAQATGPAARTPWKSTLLTTLTTRTRAAFRP